MKLSRRRIREISGPLLSSTVLVYFLYHLIQGERGVLSLMNLRKDVKQNEEICNRLSEEKDYLEHKIALLNTNHLDIDLLEERVYSVLHYARNDEIVIFLD